MAQMDSSTTQFEDAFDEFYIQSPQPRFVKPMFAPRGKSGTSGAASRKGVKVKALFDMMKERNSSICSESDLNSSILTSNASFCDADVQNTTDKNGVLRAKEKIAGTPEKDHDETDHLSERSTPRTHHPPPVVQSPALRIGLNFVQHAALVDASDSFSSTSTADKENLGTRPAPVVTIIDKTGREQSSLSHRGFGSRPNTAKSLSLQGSHNRHVTGVKGNREKVSENVSEICSTIDNVFSKVTDSRNACHSDITDSSKVCQNDNLTVPSASTSSSPGNVVSDESCADQETLQLVSKLVQRLQSSAKENKDSDWELTPQPVSLPRTHGPDDTNVDLANKTQSSDKAKRLRGRQNTLCVDNNSQSSDVAKRLRSKSQAPCSNNSQSADVSKRLRGRSKARTDNNTVITSDNMPVYNSRTNIKAGGKFPLDENDEENVTAQIPTDRTFQKSTKASKQQRTMENCSRTLRTRKNGRTVAQGSSEIEEKKTGVMRKEPAVKAGQKTRAGYQHESDTVEADIITQRRAKQVHITKDPFSLDSSLEDEQLQVEEDAITIASKTKKSNVSKPARKKSRTAEGVMPVSQALSSVLDIGITDAGPSALDDEPAADPVNIKTFTTAKRGNNAASKEPVKSIKRGNMATFTEDGKTITETDIVAAKSDKRTSRQNSFKSTSRGGVTALGADKTASRDGATAFKANQTISRAESTSTEAKDKSKILKVSCWSLQPVARLKGVRIEGKLPYTDYFWLSSVIVERVSSRILKSTNGSLYQLMGNISVLNTRAAGFSQEIVQLFRRGFPVDWRELLDSNITSAESSCQTGYKDIVPTPFKRLLQQASQKPNGTVAAQPPQTPRTKPKKTVDASSFHTPTNTKKDLDDDYTIWTPKGIVLRTLEANAVRRTQSGRCIIPPLARWAGQYLKQDQDGNVTIGFASKVAEQHFAQITEEIHAPTRLKKSPARNGKNTHVKRLMTDISSPGQTEVVDCVMTNKTEKPSKSSNRAVKNKPGKKKTKNDEADPVSAKEADLRVASLEEDVMSLVQKSKQKRLQNTAKKKTDLCYSNAADEWRKSQEELSESGDSSEEDDVFSERNTKKTSSKTLNTTSRTNSHADSNENSSKRTVPKGKQSKTAVLQLDTEPLIPQKKGKNQAARKQNKNRKPSVNEDVENHTTSKSKKLSQPSKKQNTQKKKPKPIIDDDSDEDDSGNEKVSDDDENTDQLPTTKSRHQSHASKQKKILIDDDSNDENESNDDAPKHTRTSSRQQSRQKNRPKPNYNDSLEDFDDETNPQTNVTAKNKAKTLTQEKKSKKGNKRKVNGKGTTSKSEHGKEGQPAVKKPSNPSKKVKGKKAKDVDANPLPKENGPSSESTDNAHTWTPEEIEKLQRGLQTISSDHPDYWGAVSQYVGTRSPTQCAAFHLTHDKPDQCPAARPKPHAKPAKTNKDDKTPSLKGKRGTLKRRQEIRAILEHDSNNNMQDDIFDATPFRTKKRAKIAAVDFSKTDEEVFGRNPNFFTPRADGSQPGGVLFGCTPASSKKTPSLLVTHSPWQQKDSAQKRDVDLYLFRMQKNKRQLTKTFNKKKKACEDENSRASCATGLSLFHQSPPPSGLFEIREEEPGDDEEAQDYYFSEDDN